MICLGPEIKMAVSKYGNLNIVHGGYIRIRISSGLELMSKNVFIITLPVVLLYRHY